jgi:hypothetical protein
VGTLKTDVGTLKTDVITLKTDVGTLKTDVGTLKVGQVELRRHMDVLHEEVLDRLKAVTLDPQAIDDKIERGDNAVRAEFNQRIALIETAIRPPSKP